MNGEHQSISLHDKIESALLDFSLQRGLSHAETNQIFAEWLTYQKPEVLELARIMVSRNAPSTYKPAFNETQELAGSAIEISVQDIAGEDWSVVDIRNADGLFPKHVASILMQVPGNKNVQILDTDGNVVAFQILEMSTLKQARILTAIEQSLVLNELILGRQKIS